MSSTKGDEIVYTFKGPGIFYGIPAEDLTKDAFDALPADYQRKVVVSTIYEEAKTEKAHDAPKTDAKDGDKK